MSTAFDNGIAGRLEGEAALCIWEDMLSVYTGDGRSDFASPMPGRANLILHWTDVGTMEMRHHALSMAASALRVFEMVKNFGEPEDLGLIPYDWAFIPWFVNLTSWDDLGWHLPTDDEIREAIQTQALVHRARMKVTS